MLANKKKLLCFGCFYENVFEGFCYELKCEIKSECKALADKVEDEAQRRVADYSECRTGMCI